MFNFGHYLCLCTELQRRCISPPPTQHIASLSHINQVNMPPKAPSQAGRFKPLKRPAKKPEASTAAEGGAASSANTSSSDRAGGGGRGQRPSRGDANDRGSGRGGRGDRSKSPGGRGRGARGGGRAGSGRGGRGGRFIAPTGAAFFTGACAKRSDTAGGFASVAAVGGGGDVNGDDPRTEVKIAAGQDGAIFIPGSSSASGAVGSRGSSGINKVSNSAAESMAAAARAKLGEGEEIVVAEMELEDGETADDGKKKSVLDGPSRSERFDGMPSLFDDENDVPMISDHATLADAFVYDSDSSEEERRVKRKQQQRGGGGGKNSNSGVAPTQLPFPVGVNQQPMYNCQEGMFDDEKKIEAEPIASSSTTQASSKLNDPPIQSPFLDVTYASEEMKQAENNSWFLMKFPTRLPHLDNNSMVSSTKSGKKAVKAEVDEDGLELVGSANVDTSMDIPTAATSVSSSATVGGALGYDDTLKDCAPGKYGKIVVFKSGRTELVVGGGDSGRPEVRMLIHEGLQCGFRQEAVSIDPEEATFVPMGDVGKALVVVPDVERAFAHS